MDRRNFLRSMLGVAAATALPSEVWPFKKIFLPPAPTLLQAQLDVNAVLAIELESFAREIPDLVYKSTPLYDLLKKREYVSIVGPNQIAFNRIVDGPDLSGIAVDGYMGPELGPFFGLNRSPYPGRLGKSLLHSPATPENIMRFANELENISKPKS